MFQPKNPGRLTWVSENHVLVEENHMRCKPRAHDTEPVSLHHLSPEKSLCPELFLLLPESVAKCFRVIKASKTAETPGWEMPFSMVTCAHISLQL